MTVTPCRKYLSFYLRNDGFFWISKDKETIARKLEDPMGTFSGHLNTMTSSFSCCPLTLLKSTLLNTG